MLNIYLLLLGISLSFQWLERENSIRYLEPIYKKIRNFAWRIYIQKRWLQGAKSDRVLKEKARSKNV